MYSNFRNKHKDFKCSYELYCSVIREMKIPFAKLGHEECDQCEVFMQHNPNHKKDSLNPNCEYCTKWSDHNKKARICRDEYQKDCEKYNTENGVRYSADLQKIMMLPRMDGFKSALFTRRIVTFHKSFVPLK